MDGNIDKCDVFLFHVRADKDIFATLLHGWPPRAAEHGFSELPDPEKAKLWC